MTTLPFIISSAAPFPNAQETALLDLRRLLHSLLDALSSHIAILDEHGTIIEINAAWKRFASENGFGGNQHGVGDNYLGICESASGSFYDEASAVAIGIRAVMAGRSDEFHLEYSCHSPKEPRWFVVRATRFGGEGPVRVVIAHEKITELKQNEERFRRALEHEHELSQIKSRFVTMVSHEFRTPLGVINTAAHLLGRYLDRMSGEERSTQVQEIQSSVKRMTQMMEEFLLQGEFETGRIECKPSPVNVDALCRRIISEVTNHLGASCPVECVVAPAAREAFIDEKILRHILGNLLSNAVKYSRDSLPVRIELKRVPGNARTDGDTKRTSGDQLQLQVRDSGIGIPIADRSMLYRPFHRASNVGNRPGTGMGLAIVKQCVDLHRGTIRVESAEGVGTTVWVCLPIATPATTTTDNLRAN